MASSEIMPSSDEFSILEHVVFSPLNLKMMVSILKGLDDWAVEDGRLPGSASNSFSHLLELGAIEVLDEAAVLFRRKRVAGGPYPLDYLRSPGRLDLSVLGSEIYERGRQVRAKKPNERVVISHCRHSRQVHYWDWGVQSCRIVLPSTVATRNGDDWSVDAVGGASISRVVVHHNFRWRHRWWEEPRRGLHIAFRLVEADQ
jgi:hypothetical protein